MTQENHIDSIFPLDGFFKIGGLSKTFLNHEEFLNWIIEEQKKWRHYRADRNSIAQNYAQLDSVKQSDPQNLKQAAEALQEEYLPYEAIQSFVEAIGEADSARVSTFIQEVLAPNSAHNDSRIADLKALALVFRSYGSLSGQKEYYARARQDVEGIYADSKSLLDETKKFKEAFQTEIALQAPRAYWERRAEDHRIAFGESRKWWSWSLLVLIAAVVSFLIFWACGSFSLAVDAGATENKIFLLVERIAIIGTLFAFIVWWLRQHLRDMRSHEHLAEDAAERVTMIDTYNAMRSAGLQNSDLEPILKALYRPATTGIIDDNGPALPSEILIKSISGKIGAA